MSVGFQKVILRQDALALATLMVVILQPAWRRKAYPIALSFSHPTALGDWWMFTEQTRLRDAESIAGLVRDALFRRLDSTDRVHNDGTTSSDHEDR